jgi:hypothetical protein
MNCFRAYFFQLNKHQQPAIYFSIALNADIEFFHFLSSPGSLPQKCETRFDAGIKSETPNINDTAQVFPSEMFNQFGNDHFERFSMEWIFGWHGLFDQKANIREMI